MIARQVKQISNGSGAEYLEVVGDPVSQLVERIEGAGRRQHGTEREALEWQVAVALDGPHAWERIQLSDASETTTSTA